MSKPLVQKYTYKESLVSVSLENEGCKIAIHIRENRVLPLAVCEDKQ
jgi:hypothetical protein